MDSTEATISFLSTNRGPLQVSCIDKCVRSNFTYCLKNLNGRGESIIHCFHKYSNLNIKTLFISMETLCMEGLFYYCIVNVYGMSQEFIFITMYVMLNLSNYNQCHKLLGKDQVALEMSVDVK